MTSNSRSLPEHQPLFPTMGSVQEVLEYAESKLPITDKNELVTLLGTYSNTVLARLNRHNQPRS